MYRDFKILLVEDSEGDVYLCKLAFKKINPLCRIDVCTDGEQAIEYIKKEENIRAKPDLILLDVNLPGMNGIELLKEIRSTADYKLACIAVYSSSYDAKMIAKIYKEGAHYFMNKPIHNDEYMRELSALYASCLGSKS